MATASGRCVWTTSFLLILAEPILDLCCQGACSSGHVVGAPERSTYPTVGVKKAAERLGRLCQMCTGACGRGGRRHALRGAWPSGLLQALQQAKCRA